MQRRDRSRQDGDNLARICRYREPVCTRVLPLTIVVAAACINPSPASSIASPKTPPAVTPVYPPCLSARRDQTHVKVGAVYDEVVAAALEQFLETPKSVPDSSLLPAGPVYVMVDIAHVPDPAAMPASPRPFVLVDRDQLQAEADRTRKPVGYIRFSTICIERNRAWVTIGVEHTLPTWGGSGGGGCSARETYQKTNRGWTMIEEGPELCG